MAVIPGRLRVVIITLVLSFEACWEGSLFYPISVFIFQSNFSIRNTLPRLLQTFISNSFSSFFSSAFPSVQLPSCSEEESIWLVCYYLKSASWGKALSLPEDFSLFFSFLFPRRKDPFRWNPSLTRDHSPQTQKRERRARELAVFLIFFWPKVIKFGWSRTW